MNKIGVVGISGGWSSEKLKTVLEKKTKDVYLIEMEDVFFDSKKETLFYKDMDLSSFDALIIKKIGANYSADYLNRLELLRYLNERKEVRVFSKPDHIIRIFNRLSCTMTMQIHNIPIPPVVITEDLTIAEDAVSSFKKAVFKPLYSTKAKGMMVISIDDDVKAKIKKFAGNDNAVMYIQQYINIPKKDYGLVFIGGTYIASYARVKNKSSWNTTIHSGGRYEEYNPSKKMISLADKAQSIFNLDFTCVDIAETDEGLFVFEVSAFGGFRGLRDANKIDAASLYADYVLKKLEEDD